jgi:hypothetical protein
MLRSPCHSSLPGNQANATLRLPAQARGAPIHVVLPHVTIAWPSLGKPMMSARVPDASHSLAVDGRHMLNI